MTVYELIGKLSQYPSDAKVVLATDWSEPLVDDEYLLIDGDPTVALACSAHGSHPDEVARLRELVTV